MKELTSLNNELVKFVSSLSQKKYRDEHNLFIVEGEKGLEGALKNNFNIKYIFTTENFLNMTLNKTLKQVQGDNKIDNDNIFLVNEKIMKKISTTESSAPVLSVVEKKKYCVQKEYSRVILLENIKDNGNLGTIIRSAAAFDIDAVVLLGECCDLYSPKTIRSSVGTFFQIPVIEYKSTDKLKTDFKDFKFISTNLHNKSDTSLSEIKDKFVLMFGSEADGLSDETTKLANNNFILPINSKVESLNLATALSIVLYEISKNF